MMSLEKMRDSILQEGVNLLKSREDLDINIMFTERYECYYKSFSTYQGSLSIWEGYDESNADGHYTNFSFKFATWMTVDDIGEQTAAFIDSIKSYRPHVKPDESKIVPSEAPATSVA